MRRLLLVLLAAGLVLAGCGSSSPGAPPNPVASELSYYPAQSPFVLTVATKPSVAAQAGTQALEAKIPAIALAKTALFAKLAQLGIDYQKDIRPLFGHPLAFGVASPTLSTFSTNFLVAWMTSDAGRLKALIPKLRGLRAAGTHDGAKLYESSSGAAAVDGATLLFARSVPDVTAALDRHARSQGINSARYSAATAGLDPNATVKIYGDLTSTLSTPSTATARRIPWVAALRAYGASVGASASGLTIKFRVDTGGQTLQPSQLPIAAGSASPGLVAGLPIQVGVRDPAQIANFVESALQLTSPQKYSSFLKAQARLRRKIGVDANSLISQLGGDLIIDSDTHTTLARAGVGNPAEVGTILAKVASVPHGLGGKTTLSPAGHGFYAFTDGGRQGLIAVIGKQLVIGVPPKGERPAAAALRSFAAAAGTPVAGAAGAVSFRVQLPALLALVIKQPSPTAQQLLGLLGDVTGSMAATPSALSGTATLGLK